MLLVQGCFRGQGGNGLAATTEESEAVVRATTFTPAHATSTPPPTPTPASTAVEPSPTPEPTVTVTAVNGNLYIRRGPGTAYDRIGVLNKGETAQVIGRDVLSKWAQIQIPGSEETTGWVSLLTEFSEIQGDLSLTPSFTFTDWPRPAYIENCTEHDLLILPNELYLYNLYTNDKYLNEVQIDPGTYKIQDLFADGQPVYMTVDVREGQTLYITENALGELHKCGEKN
jgi:hypothetical protein